MYFNATPVSMSELKFDIFKNSDFILTDISSIELLFRVIEQKLDDVIDAYIKQEGYSLYDFINELYSTDFESSLEILVKKDKYIE